MSQEPYHTPMPEVTSATFYTVMTIGYGAGRTTQIAYLPFIHNQAAYVRYRHDQTWGEWQKFATATSPQQFDLPLAEGVTSYEISKYCKTQENIVIVNFAVVFADVKTGSGSYLFANLPAGFRPNGVIVTSASSWCESPLSRNAVECDVRQDGGIYISTTEQSIQYVHGQVVFVAG